MHKGPWQVQLIDEEVVILLAVSRAYRDKPVDIVTATNADQALAQMDIFNFDLFLLDLDMKDSCSFRLLKTMTERFADVPVILMTTGDIGNEALVTQIEAARSQGCWHLLEKPFDYKKLTGFIDRGLQERAGACCNGVHGNVSDPQEKRRCKRFSRYEQINISLPVATEAACRTVPLLATLTDISVGGLCLTTRKQLPAFQTIDFDEKFMHQSGTVVWSHALDDHTYRTGIQFT